MLDVIDAVMALLEPDGSGVTRDMTAARPFTWNETTLYGWISGDDHELAGSGDPIPELERFGLTLVYVADSSGEEAAQIRDRSVSTALDTKAHAYTALIAANRSRYANGTPAPWQHLQATIDYDLVRDFAVRGFALRVTGYRYL